MQKSIYIIFLIFTIIVFNGCVKTNQEIITYSTASEVPLEKGYYEDFYGKGESIDLTKEGKRFVDKKNFYIGYFLKFLDNGYYLLQRNSGSGDYHFLAAKIEINEVILYDFDINDIQKYDSKFKADARYSGEEILLLGNKDNIYKLFKYLVKNKSHNLKKRSHYKKSTQHYPIKLLNNTSYETIDVAIHYKNSKSNKWTTEGWWTLEPGETIHPNLKTKNKIIYVYAKSDDYTWGSGSSIKKHIVSNAFKRVKGNKLYGKNKRTVKFYKTKLKNSEYEFRIKYNN